MVQKQNRIEAEAAEESRGSREGNDNSDYNQKHFLAVFCCCLFVCFQYIYLAKPKSGAPQFLFNSICIHATLLIV